MYFFIWWLAHQLKTLYTKNFTRSAARKELQPALENLYTVVDAFFISAQIEGLEETIDILNKTIDRALASARRYSGKTEPETPTAPDDTVTE